MVDRSISLGAVDVDLDELLFLIPRAAASGSKSLQIKIQGTRKRSIVATSYDACFKHACKVNHKQSFFVGATSAATVSIWV